MESTLSEETNDMDKSESNAEVDIDQQNTGEVTFQFYCQYCGDSYSAFPELEEHIAAEHEENNENTEISLNDDASILRYTSSQNKITDKPEPVDNASKESPAKKSDNTIVVHKCQFCDKSFLDRNEFEKHIDDGHDTFESSKTIASGKTWKLAAKAVKTGKNEYFCPFCQERFSKHFQVLRHILNIHETELKATETETGLAYMFSKCEFCEKMFTCESELAIHKNRHTKELLYRCPFCVVETFALKDTFQHMKRMHKDKAEFLDKNSVLKFPNPNSVTAKLFSGKWVDKDFPGKREKVQSDVSMDKAESAAVTSDLTADSLTVKAISDKPVSETTRIRDSSRNNPNEAFYKCPYCTFATHFSLNLEKHVKSNHETHLNTGLKELKHDGLDHSIINQDGLKQTKKAYEADLSNVPSYFQCQFCSHKCISKSNILKHLNSNKHAEERKNGDYELLDISKLRVSNNVPEIKSNGMTKASGYFQCPFCSYRCFKQDKLKRHLSTNKHMEQRKTGEIAKLDISKLKVNVHVVGEKRSSKETLAEYIDDVSSNKKNNGEVMIVKPQPKQLNAEETESEQIRNTFQLSKFQPFVKLEKMKLRVKLPQSDKKSSVEKGSNQHKKESSRDKEAIQKGKLKQKGGFVKDGLEETIPKPEDGNVCPYCKFKCSRASALQFHINFNHKKEKAAGTSQSVSVKGISHKERTPSKSSSPNKTLESTSKNTKTKLPLGSTRKSFGKSNTVARKQVNEEEKCKGKNISNKRKLDTRTDNTQAKKLKSDSCTATTEKSCTLNEDKQTFVVNVDGTLVTENELKSSKIGQESVVEITLSEIDESNEIGMDSPNKKSDAANNLESGMKENNREQNEVILFVCPFCNGRFKSVNSLKKHVISYHKKENISEDDIEVVIEEYKGPWHKQAEGIRKPFKCPFCEEMFESKLSIKAHVKSLHEAKNLPRTVVPLPTITFPDKGIDCTSGDNETENSKATAIKQQPKRDGNGGVSLFGCPNCDLKFKALRDALEHLLAAHGGAKTPDMNNSPTKDTSASVTESSDLSQGNMESNNENIEENLTVEWYKCPECDVCYESTEAAEAHIKHVHDNINNDENKVVVVLKNSSNNGILDPERYQCPACPLQLRWKHSILKHARKHHPDESITSEKIMPVSDKTLVERYFCPYCDLQFKWRNSIPRHVGRVHQDQVPNFRIELVETRMIPAEEAKDVDEEADIKPIVHSIESEGELEICTCTKCNKTFGTLKALQKHNVLVHNADGKPYKCGKCGKCFVYEYQINAHLKAHTYKKAPTVFSCDHEGCPKRFSEKKVLYSHLRKEHGEEDPVARLGTRKGREEYLCKECNSVFTSRAAFWRHNLERHNKEPEKMHQCKVCLKSFLRPHDLKDHMFVHMSTSDLECPIVGCFFKTKKLKYLAEHIGRQHGIKMDSKSLGKHVLSEKKMSSEELNLFPTSAYKIKEELAANVEATINQDNSIEPQGENSSEMNGGSTVEKDSQIEFLEAKVKSQFEVKSEVEERNDENMEEGNEESMVDSSDPNVDEKWKELPAGQRYLCKLCDDVFPTHRQLIKHKVAKHIEELEVYRCEQCRKTFFTIYDLKEHTLLAHPISKDFECQQCGKGFAAMSHLQKHQKKHQQVPEEADVKLGQVVCDICGISLRFRASLVQHIRRTHPEMVTCDCKICTAQLPIEQVANNPTVKYCTICNKYFCSKVIYNCHMRGSHNTTARHTCNFCPQVFSTLMQMKSHMHQMHTDVARSERSEVTDGELTSTTSDTHHVIEISNEEAKGPKFLPKLSEAGLKAVAKELKVYVEEPSGKHWKCLLCGSCFSKVKYFNMHVRRLHVRAEHQPFRCKLCGSGFARVAEFRKHTRTHSGFRPLMCNICHKSFKQQCHLKEHLLIHGTSKTYRCEICLARFKQRGALLAHVIRHDKLKPFKCHFCGVGFTIRWALSKHMKKYLEADNPDTHLCHICHKTFPFFPLLLKHIQSHQEPNPWSCEVCDKTFAAYTSYYDHKCKQKHFIEGDYEIPEAQKQTDTGIETTEAIGSLMDVGGDPAVIINAQELDSGALVIETGQQEDNPPAVEIVIQDQGSGEPTTYKVEGHTDVDILSIAKQLTEMSGSLAQDIYIEEVVQPTKSERHDEEEKIMMTMLDADEDVKLNLEKNLSLKSETITEQSDSNMENRYIQIVQAVDESTTDVGEGNQYVVLEGPEHMEQGYMEVEGQQEGEVLTAGAIQNSTTIIPERIETVNENSAAVSKNVTIMEEEGGCKPDQERMAMDSAPVASSDKLEIVNNRSSSVESQVTEEQINNTTSPHAHDLEAYPSVSANEHEVTTEVTTSEFQGDATVSCENQENVLDGQESQVEYVIQYSEPENIEIAQAEGVIEDTEISVSNMFEQPALQTEYDDSPHISIENQESQVEENQDESNSQNQAEMNEAAETVGTHSLIPVTIPEYGEQPLYMFKKADGSLVYIQVPEDQVVDNADIINAALEADVYLEQQSYRDDSTLEAAEILKSVASGTSTILEQVGQERDVQGEEDQVFQLQINEDGMNEEAKPGLVIQDIINEAGRMIKTEGSSEETIAYQCTICNSVLKSKKNLRFHLRRHARTEDRAFECTHCGKRFVSNSELTRHTRVHTDDRPCECEICGKKFRQPGHLMAHRYTHTGERPFSCRLCPCKFTTSTLLKVHMTKHTNIRSFKCGFCDRAFKTMRELTMHRAVHSGLVGKNKIFKMPSTIKTEDTEVNKKLEDGSKKLKHICHICGKNFSGKTKLDDHVAAHENLRSFICDVCGQGFNTKSAVDSHAFSHIDERPEICETCGGAFKTKKSLRLHQKKHKKAENTTDEERRYRCPACDKRFKSRSALYYHIGSSSDCMPVDETGSNIKEEF